MECADVPHRAGGGSYHRHRLIVDAIVVQYFRRPGDKDKESEPESDAEEELEPAASDKLLIEPETVDIRYVKSRAALTCAAIAACCFVKLPLPRAMVFFRSLLIECCWLLLVQHARNPGTEHGVEGGVQAAHRAPEGLLRSACRASVAS